MKFLKLFFVILFIIPIIVISQNKKSKVEDKKTMSTDFIHWYGQSAFRIEDGVKQIYIDPFKLPGGELKKADVIFITHSHFDHFSPDDIEKIKKNETLIFLPEDLATKLKGNITVVKPNASYSAGNIKIKTIPAYNPKKQFHPKSNNWVGYIITLSNGLVVYHAGDTDVIPEMKKVKADIVFIPIGGTYTMTHSEAAEIINIIKPKITIPMHYGDVVGTDKDAEAFKKEVTTQVVIKQREK
jgi:L-ascorbate metabolism protein UlaG (beta-lactamase superfamily)